jgi:hypothetical protein
VVDADGVLWSGTTDGLVGIDARGATRDLPGVRLRDPVLGPDGALYGEPADRGSDGVLRVVPATGEVATWPGEVDGPLVAAGDGVYAIVRGQGIARLGPDGPQVVGPELRGRLAGDRRGTLWWTDGAQVTSLGGEPLAASAVGCLGPIFGLEEGAGRVWARCGARLVAVETGGPTGATWTRPGRFAW